MPRELTSYKEMLHSIIIITSLKIHRVYCISLDSTGNVTSKYLPSYSQTSAHAVMTGLSCSSLNVMQQMKYHSYTCTYIWREGGREREREREGVVGRECAVRSVAASESLVRLHPTPQPPQPGRGHNKHREVLYHNAQQMHYLTDNNMLNYVYNVNVLAKLCGVIQILFLEESPLEVQSTLAWQLFVVRANA